MIDALGYARQQRAGIIWNVPLKEDDILSDKVKEKENRIWGLSSKVFNSKKNVLCYPTSSVLSGKQMCTSLVLSRRIWTATASPAVHSGMAKVALDLDEIVGTQGKAGESCSGTSPADLMPGACQWRERREHPPVPGEKTLKTSLSVLPEAEVLEKLPHTGLGWLDAPLYAATAGLQQRSALGRGGEREDGLNEQHMTEEITEDQSTCLFKAADLSVGEFCSSSTLKTTVSVKQNAIEKAIPGAPPCCPRLLFAANQQRRFFFSVV